MAEQETLKGLGPNEVVVTFTRDEAWTAHGELNEAFGECEPPWNTSSSEEQETSGPDDTDLKAQRFFRLRGALYAVRMGLRDAGEAFLGEKEEAS